MREYTVLCEIHGTPKGIIHGILPPQDVFYEPVRVSLVSRLMAFDCYAACEYYSRSHGTEGVPLQVATVWLAQLLYAVKILEDQNLIHRDIVSCF
jgi:serine/threonine protein kinase